MSASEYEQLPTTEPQDDQPHPETERSPSTRSPPPNLSLIGGTSLLIALLAILLLFYTETVHLSHSPSSYYTQTLMHQPPPRTLRFGSFNIRYSPGGPLRPIKSFIDSISKRAKEGSRVENKDEIGKWGEAKWEERREKLVDQVLFHELDVVGFQEVLDHQLNDLKVFMGEEWDYVGVGRNDGKKAGEAVPIFYRRSRLSLVSSSHHWLSPTPDVPGSRGWDAGQPRMVTIVRLRDKTSSSTDKGGEEIVVANTHWDDRGLEARTESAKLILTLLAKEAERDTAGGVGRAPLVVLVGDLNSPAEEEGYRVLTGGRYGGALEQQGDKTSFWDSRHEIATRQTSLGGPNALSGPYGPLNTFTGFVPSDVAKVIDFILVFDIDSFISPSKRSSSPPATTLDSAFLDADDPDEVLASIPAEEENQAQETLKRDEKQTRWKVSRYGVVPNFYEDVGGKRPKGSNDGMIVSDHRLVVVAMEEIVA